VAFVSDAHEFAGAEYYMVLIIEALADRFDFLVVVGTGAAEETVSKAEAAGARIAEVKDLRRKPFAAAPIRLARLLRRTDPALVHVNLSDQGDGAAASFATRFVRSPVVATLHNVIPGRTKQREFASHAMLRSTDDIIAVSDDVGRYLEKLDLRHVVVKNGLLPPRLDPAARERLGLDPNAFVVGGIGRLHHQKGWDVLCAAAPVVRARRPDLEIVVVGDGPLSEELRQAPGADSVRFLGYMADASSLLGAFDLLVVPSRYEGFGLVALEGMSAGVPIVASRVNGLVEVIGDSGRHVPAEAPAALADAILELAADQGLRTEFAGRALERAQRLFHRDRMAEQTAAVYETLLDGPAEPRP
jgi:glycosyltransferase involved in cell wall biosynthesis